MLQRVIWVCLGGALGALCRWLLGASVQRWAGVAFPWGTATVNIVGCFCFGVFWAFSETRLDTDSVARFAVLTGFMGAFTTFSTFAFDSVALLQAGRYAAGIGNIALQNAAGLTGLVIGFGVGRSL